MIKSDDGLVRRVKVEYKCFGANERTDTSYKGKPYTEIERPIQRLIVLSPSDEGRNRRYRSNWLVVENAEMVGWSV